MRPRLAAHEVGREVELGRARELSNDLAAFGLLDHLLALGLQAFAGDGAQFRVGLAGGDLLGEGVIERRELLTFQLAHLDGVIELFALERFDGNVGGHVQNELAGLARRRTDQGVAEAGQQRLRTKLDPEVFLAAEFFGRVGHDLIDWLPFQAAREVDHAEIIHLQAAPLDVGELGHAVPQGVERAVHLGVGDFLGRQFDGQPLVGREFELRGGDHPGGKAEGVVQAEFDLVNVANGQDTQFLFGDGLASGGGNELALEFVGDLLLVTGLDEIRRCLARAVAGQLGRALVVT